jgi:cytochrome c peroxidase
MYEDVFGPLPRMRWESVRPTASPNGDAEARAAWAALPEGDRTDLTRAFANLGKSIAAHERTLRSRPSRFDAYVDAVLAGRPRAAARALDARERAGLELFLSGRSGCLSCHHGPLFSDGQFHNIGTGELGTPEEDLGRAAGREQLRSAEFSCTSSFGDGPCLRLPAPHRDALDRDRRSDARRLPHARACATCPPPPPICTTAGSRRSRRCSPSTASRPTSRGCATSCPHSI